MYFKELAHVTVEAGSQRWEAEMESLEPADTVELDSPSIPAWFGVFTSVPRQLRGSILIPFWQGDNLCLKFSLLLQSVFCGFLSSSISNITANHPGNDSCREMIKPEGKAYLWSHTLLYK